MQTAVFVALGVVIRVFAIYGNSRITFDYIPVVLSGVFLGPFAGLIVGALTDTLAFLINPMGMWSPVFLVTSAITGLIPGLVFKFLKVVKNDFVKLTIAVILVYIAVPLTLNPLGIYFIFLSGMHSLAFGVWYAGRLPAQTIAYLINAVVIFALYKPLKQFVKLGEDKNQTKIKKNIELDIKETSEL